MKIEPTIIRYPNIDLVIVVGKDNGDATGEWKARFIEQDGATTEHAVEQALNLLYTQVHDISYDEPGCKKLYNTLVNVMQLKYGQHVVRSKKNGKVSHTVSPWSEIGIY